MKDNLQQTLVNLLVVSSDDGECIAKPTKHIFLVKNLLQTHWGISVEG